MRERERIQERFLMNKVGLVIGRAQLALEAAAFAEVGDRGGAQSLMRENRRVLLALRGLEGDARTMTYALNTCRRIGAGLDVLFVADRALPDEDLRRALAPFLANLAEAGIPCRTTPAAGCIKEQIIRYTKAHPEVSFVVVESAGVLGRGCGIDDERRLSKLWKRLTCPLVVVSDPAQARQAVENGPSAAFRPSRLTAVATGPPLSSGVRKPGIWTLLSSLPVTR
jgi:hypothetical protein